MFGIISIICQYNKTTNNISLECIKRELNNLLNIEFMIFMYFLLHF